MIAHVSIVNSMADGKFSLSKDVVRDLHDGFEMGWHSRPETTNSSQLVVIEVNIESGSGHNFHYHPNQEEVIFVLEGKVEQWLDNRKMELTKGDSVFIPEAMVHATFNVSSTAAKVIAILSPSVGPEGYEVNEVHEKLPWSELRQ